ncbi:T7SS effector LXG polymorphic toxin [Psychrobacillus sp. FJAT-51614]|uniref:T7SS effector LXG polymorphic toxin n=1 Tax=Psychrobacillus mangrovi TaxID=3117745 RepID=A0ABU8FCH4_9BACI
MKILDVDLFQDGLQRNITMLDRLSSEIEAIHRAIDELVQMEDQLKGEGGNAIRSFYGECHLPFLQYFQLFSENFNQVLHQMKAALNSLEPDSTGYILEQFLEGELEQGLTFIGQLTASLTDETNSIMDQVSDIVGLPHLDDSGVQEGVINSKWKRDDTVTQLHEFDSSQTTALTPIEQDMQTMETWLADLEGLYNDGLTDIHFQTNQWAALASCNPLLTDLATSTAPDIDSAEVESENDTIVDTGIEVVKGVGTGIYDAGKDFVVGLWDTITNPKATVEGLVNAVTNPVETYNVIKTAISESYDRDMVNGDANSRAHWVAYAIGTVATSIIGTKGTNALVKTGTTAVKAAAPTIVATTKTASTSLTNLLPYSPRYQLAMQVGVPYNTVNGMGYRDQLFSMAKITSGVNGAGKDQVTNVSKNLNNDKKSIPNSIFEPKIAESVTTKGTGKDYKNYNAVEYTGTTKVNGEVRDISRRVFQRIDIDYKRIDPDTGMTNFQLMKKGRAPIWKDGTVIELHHLIQREPGSMVEIPASMHDEYNKILHGLVENGGSFRNDPVLKKQYDNFRSKYWRWRAKQIDKGEL